MLVPIHSMWMKVLTPRLILAQAECSYLSQRPLDTPFNEPPRIDSPSDICRQCVACRQIVPRTNLLRILHDRKTGAIVVLQPTSKKRISSGRSAYLCLQQSCLHTALKGKKIQKALKTS